MRSIIVAGNWKMNKSIEEAVELAQAIKEQAGKFQEIEKIVCPPFLTLQHVKEVLDTTFIKIGAQNMFWEEKGAFTGEISPSMLHEICHYVILGHSERRMVLGETDEMINKKMVASQHYEITPILCVGESLEVYEERRTVAFIQGQIHKALEGLEAKYVESIIIAYEPIWAIGTGKTASPQEANTMCKAIRDTLKQKYDQEVSEKVHILYGGSVNSGNIAEIVSQSDIDGVLVGGASLHADEYAKMCEVAEEVQKRIAN